MSITYTVEPLSGDQYRVTGISQAHGLDVSLVAYKAAEIDTCKAEIELVLSKIEPDFLSGVAPYSSLPPSEHCEACQ